MKVGIYFTEKDTFLIPGLWPTSTTAQGGQEGKSPAADLPTAVGDTTLTCTCEPTKTIH